MLFRSIKKKEFYSARKRAPLSRQKPGLLGKRKNEDFFLDYRKDQYKKFLVLRRNYADNAKQYLKFSKISHVLFLVFFSFFLGFRFLSSYDWYYWRFLVNAFYSADYNNVCKYFKYRANFTNLSEKSNLVQLSLFIFIFRIYNNLSNVNFLFFIEKLFVQFFLYRYVSILWFILKYKVRFLISSFNFVSQYFLISNNDINASFLSRYIAKMLDYNNTLRRVLNPLKREFKMVVKDTKIVPNLLQDAHNISFIKSAYYSFFFYFIFLCKIFFFWFFNKTSLWLTLNDFIFLARLLGFVKTTSSFRKFFLKRTSIYAFNFYSLSGSSLFINFNNKLVSFLFIENANLKSVLFSDTTDIVNSNIFKLVRYSLASSKDFFDLQYSMFNYHSLAQFVGINNLKSRIKPYKFSSFTGFKIQCLGRFSRKQRSTSFWFSLGTVPLNSTAASINYGYYTLPLRNSAITVKT